MKALLCIGEAARRLGLSVDTVRDLERSGRLKAVRTPGGHRRFDPTGLDAYQQRQGAPTTKRRQPPPPAPARRRSRVRPRHEDPPDEPLDEPEPIPRIRPAASPAKTPHEQVLDDLRQTIAERAEQTRIANLRSYSESLIPYGATASARSAVIEDMDGYVTARRFPPSTDTWDARRAITATHSKGCLGRRTGAPSGLC